MWKAILKALGKFILSAVVEHAKDELAKKGLAGASPAAVNLLGVGNFPVTKR